MFEFKRIGTNEKEEIKELFTSFLQRKKNDDYI